MTTTKDLEEHQWEERLTTTDRRPFRICSVCLLVDFLDEPSFNNLVTAIGYVALYRGYREMCLRTGQTALGELAWLRMPSGALLYPDQFLRALQAGVIFTPLPVAPPPGLRQPAEILDLGSRSRKGPRLH
jgi:hypothetical protein